jgi:hypothetical protein
MNERQRIEEVEGIDFTFNQAIDASAFVIVDLALTLPYSTYAPFDALHIFNNSSSLIYLYLNQNPIRVHPIAGKTEKTITGVKIFSLRLEEKSAGAVAAADLTIQVFKSGATPETLSKKIASIFVR